MTDFVPNDTFREIRRKKLSRRQLAVLLETSVTNIARWESGEAWPEPAMLRMLCTLFALSPEELGFSEGWLSQRKEDSQHKKHDAQDAYERQARQMDSHDQTGHSVIYDSSIPLLPAVPIVGRVREILQIKQRLRAGVNSTLIALNGLPGIGKTTLAIALAYDNELRLSFCNGILWAGLGPDPHLLEILNRWGSLLGISETQLATLSSISSWTTALRIAIGDRKMLLVIDDAWKLDDVLALQVGGPNCIHLVTTRFAHIAAHNAIGGAIQLQELGEAESIELLHLLAPRVVDAEPGKVSELVHSVGGLPLALTLMGNYLRTQTANKLARRITTTLERLSHSNERLQVYELNPSGEKHPGLPGGALLSLQSVIAVSDQLLNPSARTALYALSIFPPKPQSFSEEAALAVASCTYEDLDKLSDAGIIESHSDRHMLHQVIADYARLQLKGQAEQEVIEHLISYISAFVEENKKEYDMLELESSTIRVALDLVDQAPELETQIISITCSFVPFLITRGLYNQAEYHLQQAYDIACRASASSSINEARGGKFLPTVLIQLLLYLGEIAQKRGALVLAESYFRRGLEHVRTINHVEYTCDLLKNLGWIADRQGDYSQSDTYLQESLQLARQKADRERLCSVLAILGSLHINKGEYEQAETFLEEGLSLARKFGDRQQICSLLMHRGALYGIVGNFLRAEDYFQEALFYARQIGHREWISVLLTNLGDIAHEHDDYQHAEDYFQEVLVLAREMGHCELLCVTLINLAAIARKRENYVQAQSYLEESFALSRQIEHPQVMASVLYEHAELYFDLELAQEAKEVLRVMAKIIPPGNRELFALAYYGQARALASLGNISEAREVGTRSAEMLETMQHRKAQEVRSWIEDLS